MHPKIQEYLNRYKSQSNFKYQQFFTQLNQDQITTDLPYLFGIENFCLRLFMAQKMAQKICIYSDYDTDAVTATATMYWGLIELGFKPQNIFTYAPDRFTEGYGMNTEAVAKLSLEYDLIISVDCGINSTQEAAIVLENKQADLIITDHHHLKDKIPDCVAVLNPRLAQYYNENRDQTPTINYAKYQNIFDQKELEKIQTWFKKIHKDLSDFSPINKQYLSSSVTGVGVSWFCLVWLAYFLEEIGGV